MTHVENYPLGEKLKTLLLDWGMQEKWANYFVDFSRLVIVLLVAVIIYYISKYIINRLLKRLIMRSSNRWDDHLYEQRVFTRLALLLPGIILDLSLPAFISDYPVAIHYLDMGIKFYMALVILLVIVSFLNAVYKIFGEFREVGSKPVKSYIQVAKIFAYVIWGITVISWLAGQSPLTILAGLGAVSAVLLLIFKDSILGFVAGINLSSNNMVQIGDWITMPKYNADGTVFDISLITVKVRNFDNSVTLVPTYALISDSFQNWRSMPEAGGRRIRRSIYIDVFSVRVPDETLLKSVQKHLPGEVKGLGFNEPLTNLGLFRRYITSFLNENPKININETVMVRQLQMGDTGIPLEVYAFYKPPVQWENFEEFQSELFEYIFAVMPDFGLVPYQRPGGAPPYDLNRTLSF
jgi:miniconductance mechanosensitive channel